MKNLLKPIILFFLLAVIAFTGYTLLKPAPTGVALPNTAAVFETSLQSPITSSATSLTLTANSIRGGGTLSGYTCVSLDEGSSNAEQVCGILSGTSMTSLSRGISYANGTTTVSANQFSHRRGANVKQTDAPLIQRLKAQNNGEDTFENVLYYDVPKTFSTSTSLVDKNYVDNVINQGAATSSESVGGISELATQIEMASSTDLGANNPLVLQAKYATSSPDGTSQAGLFAVVSKNNGKLHQLWLDLTEAFTWTGLHTFSSGFISTASSTVSQLNIDGRNATGDKFGGDGSDSALTITSGATNYDLSNAKYFEKNFTSISITGSASVTFTNPHTSGTLIVFKSQRDVTLTSSATPMIDASEMGADGGAAATAGTDSNYRIIDTDVNGGQVNSGRTGGVGGVIFSSKDYYTKIANDLYSKTIKIAPGSGGSGGGSGTATGGAGGKGGGAFYLETGGDINFTTTNGISVAGANGSAGGSSGEEGAGGGAGGAGGMAIILYNTATAVTGTINNKGGDGGNGGAGGSTNASNGLGGGGGGGSYTTAGGAGGDGGLGGGTNPGAAGNSPAAGSAGGGGGGGGGAGNGSAGGSGGSGGTGGASDGLLITTNKNLN